MVGRSAFWPLLEGDESAASRTQTRSSVGGGAVGHGEFTCGMGRCRVSKEGEQCVPRSPGCYAPR